MTNDSLKYSIGETAEKLGVSVETIRMYERSGLILTVKTSGNQRLFSDSDIDRLECIRKAINEEKLSIAGIRKIYSFIPCWDILGCSVTDRKQCAAFNGHSQPCWVYSHKKTTCATLDCRKCEVYAMSSDCGKIKTSITTIGKNIRK